MDGSDSMLQEQNGIKRIPGIGIVAAFGLITMSSSIIDNSFTTMNIKPDYYYESSGYFQGEETVSISSMLSKQAVGDIVLVDKESEFVQKHGKMMVNLQITKIRKHISTFDFEDDYEEI